MTILLDCDVLLDVATARAPFASESGLALDWCERNPGRGFVAWHTVANTYYLLRKSQSDDSAREFIRELLTFVEVVATGTAHARHALTLPLKDFEDALQTAAAVQAGVNYIVTRNTKDYRSAPIQAILPADFLARTV